MRRNVLGVLVGLVFVAAAVLALIFGNTSAGLNPSPVVTVATES